MILGGESGIGEIASFRNGSREQMVRVRKRVDQDQNKERR